MKMTHSELEELVVMFEHSPLLMSTEVGRAPFGTRSDVMECYQAACNQHNWPAFLPHDGVCSLCCMSNRKTY